MMWGLITKFIVKGKGFVNRLHAEFGHTYGTGAD